MWYFAWILGVLLACAFGIINVMWMETEGAGQQNAQDPRKIPHKLVLLKHGTHLLAGIIIRRESGGFVFKMIAPRV